MPSFKEVQAKKKREAEAAKAAKAQLEAATSAAASASLIETPTVAVAPVLDLVDDLDIATSDNESDDADAEEDSDSEEEDSDEEEVDEDNENNDGDDDEGDVDETTVQAPEPLLPLPSVAPVRPLVTSPGFSVPTVIPSVPQPAIAPIAPVVLELPLPPEPLPPAPTKVPKMSEPIDYYKLSQSINLGSVASLTADEIMNDPARVNTLAEIVARHLSKERRISAPTELQSKPVEPTPVVETKPPAEEKIFYPEGHEPKSNDGTTEQSAESKKEGSKLGLAISLIAIGLTLLALLYIGAQRFAANSDASTEASSAPAHPSTGTTPGTPVARANNVDASTVSSCASQLDLARAPWDATERQRLNCGHEVDCTRGIDYEARRFTDDRGMQFFDLRPRPDADLDAERRGCTIYRSSN